MRLRVLLLAVVLVAALAPVSAVASRPAGRAASSAGPAPAATLPPDLIVLEQRMSELQVSSERFVLSLSVTGAGLPKELAALLPDGEYAHGLVTFSPPAGEVTLTVFGESSTMRVVDGIVYLDVPALAGKDGGRPWLKLARRDFHKYFGGELGIEGASQPGSVAVDPYAPLRARVNAAVSISELGASTVDGQAVTGFAAKLPTLVSKVAVKGSRRKRTIRTTQKLEVFIAANGLPVRTRGVLATGRVREIASADIPAINEAVVVAAPPAAQTISLSEMKALEAKAKAEARARARARAKKHH